MFRRTPTILSCLALVVLASWPLWPAWAQAQTTPVTPPPNQNQQPVPNPGYNPGYNRGYNPGYNPGYNRGYGQPYSQNYNRNRGFNSFNQQSSRGFGQSSRYGQNDRFGRSGRSDRYGRNDRSRRGDSNDRYGRDSRNRRGRRDRDEANGRRSRSSSRRDRRGRRGGVDASVDEAGSVAGAPARARAQGKSTVVRRQAPRGGGGGKASKAVALPAIKFNREIRENTVYFSPSHLHVKEGDRFGTKLVMYNHERAPVNGVNLWVQYDPDVLEPDWVDLGPLGIDDPAGARVQRWPKRGHLQIRGDLPEARDESVSDLVVLHWRALAPALETHLEFRAPEGEAVEVLSGGSNLIQRTNLGNHSRVSMLVRVGTQQKGEVGMRLISDVRDTMDITQFDENGRIRLAIVARESLVGTDQVSTADVVLINPDREMFDELRLRIRYDPRAIKMLDADADNYISQGLNIFDGDFHDDFPFDYHGVNEVNPVEGTIDYRMGSVTAPYPYPSGTVARLVYRMKRDAGRTRFLFECADPFSSGRRCTDVTRGGLSLLGSDLEVAEQVLHGTEVVVQPLDLHGG